MFEKKDFLYNSVLLSDVVRSLDALSYAYKDITPGLPISVQRAIDFCSCNKMHTRWTQYNHRHQLIADKDFQQVSAILNTLRPLLAIEALTKSNIEEDLYYSISFWGGFHSLVPNDDFLYYDILAYIDDCADQKEQIKKMLKSGKKNDENESSLVGLHVMDGPEAVFDKRFKESRRALKEKISQGKNFISINSIMNSYIQWFQPKYDITDIQKIYPESAFVEKDIKIENFYIEPDALGRYKKYKEDADRQQRKHMHERAALTGFKLKRRPVLNAQVK